MNDSDEPIRFGDIRRRVGRLSRWPASCIVVVAFMATVLIEDAWFPDQGSGLVPSIWRWITLLAVFTLVSVPLSLAVAYLSLRKVPPDAAERATPRRWFARTRRR